MSWAIARVQRYGPDGFEMGFNYGGHKAKRLGISESGNILICFGSDQLVVFTRDGVELLPRKPCSDGFVPSPLTYTSHAKVPAIAFNWLSVLAVPF